MRKVFYFLVVIFVMLIMSTVCAADDCNIVRYVDNLDGTMTDCRSNLIWLKNANCSAPSTPLNGVTNSGAGLSWKDAMKWVAGLGNGICGLTDGSSAGDWRLPTKTEFMAMIISAKKQGFSSPTFTTYQGTSKWAAPPQVYDFHNVQFYDYWTSTTDVATTAFAWAVSLANGDKNDANKGIDDYLVWPVRGGQSGSFGTLRIE